MHRSVIPWCDDTWNPITGCNNQCRYCYAYKASRRFTGDIRQNLMSSEYRKNEELYILDNPFPSEIGGRLNYPFGYKPTYHRYRLNYPDERKHGCKILIGSMAETFGDWIPEQWLTEIFESCKRNERHNYLFLTKNPDRYEELHDKGLLPLADNFWYGTTLTDDNSYLPKLPKNAKTFICIEPILSDISIFNTESCLADWIIIGAETGTGNNKVIPKKEWVEKIIEYAMKLNIPIFLKDSLKPIMGANMKKEFPKELLERKMSSKESAKLMGECCKCKTYLRKNEMITLFSKSLRTEQPKTTAHICKKCFIEQCKEWEIKIPNLINL